MVYLDYAADTPVSDEVLETFTAVSKAFVANPNATHALGRAAKEKLEEILCETAQLLGVATQELIFTSGATESNNLAIKGVVEAYKRYGKHIITTSLEHSSVTGPISMMQEAGFEVDYVNVLPDGRVDLDHLKELLRKDTILVSTVYVDSECGTVQPIQEIAALVHEQPHCFYHVDATQAIGKVAVSFDDVDLATMTAHKINGLHGIGLLIKKEGIMLKPLHSGGVSTTPFRSGTPSLALCASFLQALRSAVSKQLERIAYVSVLNHQLRDKLAGYDQVKINSSQESSPFILNFSVLGVKGVTFAAALEEKGIYISTKSACTSPNTPSRAVYAMTHDRKRAMSTLRVSISHLTTEQEIDSFIESFDACYHQFKK